VFGVLTTLNIRQAKDRTTKKINKAKEFAEAAIMMGNLNRSNL
jgi:6,7-dimethyl-8-ribityllumazine synthase